MTVGEVHTRRLEPAHRPSSTCSTLVSATHPPIAELRTCVLCDGEWEHVKQSPRGRKKLYCPDCEPERLRRKSASAKRATTDRHLEQKYGSGFTQILRATLLRAQDGCCALCGWEVDVADHWHSAHVHHRGRYVIAILCRSCNRRVEPVMWRFWRQGLLVPSGEPMTSLFTHDANRWPATLALGFVWDRVPRENWNDDEDFVADSGAISISSDSGVDTYCASEAS